MMIRFLHHISYDPSHLGNFDIIQILLKTSNTVYIFVCVRVCVYMFSFFFLIYSHLLAFSWTNTNHFLQTRKKTKKKNNLQTNCCFRVNIKTTTKTKHDKNINPKQKNRNKKALAKQNYTRSSFSPPAQGYKLLQTNKQTTDTKI